MNSNKIQVENFMDFNSDAIITIGTRISVDHPKVKTYIDRVIAKGDSEFIYMHPIDDVPLQNKYTQYIKYEAGSEEGVFALLAAYTTSNLTVKYKEYIEDLDIGNLSGESSVGEEEFELLVEKLENKKEIILIIGDDIYEHPRFKNIANLIRLIDMYSELNVILLGQEKKINLSKDITLEETSDINTYNGSVIYVVNSEDENLRGSSSFAMAAKIKDGDSVNITYGTTAAKKTFVVDESVRGTIALYPIIENAMDDEIVSGYRFKQVQIKKVNS